MMWLGAYGATSLRPNMLVSTHTSGFAIKYTDLSGSIILQRLAVGVSRSEIANGDWVMITITKGGNTGADLKLYINGSLATTTNVFPAGTLSNSGTGNDFYFGTANQNGAPYASGYTGQFDEVSFFNTELSTDDITYLYNLGNPTSNQQYDYPSSIDNTIWSNFVNSTSKTLLNTEPVIDVVNITSTSLLSNNTLEGFCNATDYDGNSTTFEYDWYNDGVSLSINNINLTPENFIKGDDVMFSCRATDGVNFSIWKNSTAVTIFNNLQVLSGFNMIDISADTNYYFSEYIDYFRIDVTDLDEENINTYITVKNPDGDTILDNITMVNVTGDTKGYQTDLELTAVGNWTIDIVSSDDFGVILSYNTTFEVKLLIV